MHASKIISEDNPRTSNLSILILLLLFFTNVILVSIPEDAHSQRRFDSGWGVDTFPRNIKSYGNLNTLSEDFCERIQISLRSKNEEFYEWVGQVTLESVDYFKESDRDILVRYRYYRSLKDCTIQHKTGEIKRRIKVQNNALVNSTDGEISIRIPVSEFKNDVLLSMLDEYDSSTDQIDLFLRFHGEVTRTGDAFLVAESAQLSHRLYGLIWESYYY